MKPLEKIDPNNVCMVNSFMVLSAHTVEQIYLALEHLDWVDYSLDSALC